MKEKTSDAIQILRNRYIKGNPEREAALEEERINASIARKIFQMRQEKGLSQAELAKMVGTTQSVISRIEDADYKGHSLTMLHRIAKTLGCRIVIEFSKEESAESKSVKSSSSEITMSGIEKLLDKKLDVITRCFLYSTITSVSAASSPPVTSSPNIIRAPSEDQQTTHVNELN